MTTTDNAVVLYQAPDGAATFEVRLDHETVWLTQKQMAELFGKNSDTIGLHIRNAYKEGELAEDGTTEESSVVQSGSSGDSILNYTMSRRIPKLKRST